MLVVQYRWLFLLFHQSISAFLEFSQQSYVSLTSKKDMQFPAELWGLRLCLVDFTRCRPLL